MIIQFQFQFQFQFLPQTLTPAPPKSLTPKLSLSQHIPNSTPNPGLLFHQKILYLSTHLKLNPQKALQQNPNLRSAPLPTLKSVENCLLSFGIHPSSFPKIFSMHPQVLTSDPYTHLYPIFEFLLNDVSIPYRDLNKSITRCPRLLISDVDDQLRPTLLFLRKLGFIGPNKITCQNTVLLVSHVENTLVPKLEYLRFSLGLSYEEVSKMVLRSPGLLTYSIENNLRPKLEYFVEEMRGDLRELKQFPQYFSFSLEGKIKPRHIVLLECGVKLPLSDMLKVSDGEFNARLIEMRLRLVEDSRSYYKLD